MCRILTSLFLFSSLFSRGQDLTGIWRGNFNQSNSPRESSGSRYKFEVQIDQNINQFKAVTYSYLSTVFYGKATAIGTVNPKTKKVYLEELKIVDVRMSGFSSACIMTCFLQYSKDGDEEFLEGSYFSMNTADSSNCGKGTVFLRRVATSDFYKEPFLTRKPKEPSTPREKATTGENNLSSQKSNSGGGGAISQSTRKKSTESALKQKEIQERNVSSNTEPNSSINSSPNPDGIKDDHSATEEKKKEAEKETLRVSKLKNRMNELAKTITTSQNYVEVSLYDNGTIDNDTVSVYLNNRLIVNKQQLSDRPIQFRVSIDKDEEVLELTIFAENLGDVPPNTSLMIVKDGDKFHEVRLTSNEKKNAVVRFKREKPD